MPEPTAAADSPEAAELERQRAIARSVGIPVIRRHIFLCCDQTKPDCCEKERGLAAWAYLKQRLKELGPSSNASSRNISSGAASFRST
jgi:hypothetical protein